MCQVITVPVCKICKTGLLTSKVDTLVEIPLFPSSMETTAEIFHSYPQKSPSVSPGGVRSFPPPSDHFAGKRIQSPLSVITQASTHVTTWFDACSTDPNKCQALLPSLLEHFTVLPAQICGCPPCSLSMINILLWQCLCGAHLSPSSW